MKGAVWKWTPSPSAVAVEATLTGWGAIGGNPQGVLVEPSGLTYGASKNNNGDTVLWRANGAVISVLATLPYSTYGGTSDNVTLVKDSAGNILGVTSYDNAAASDGALWKWTAATGVVSKVATLGTAAAPGEPTGTLVRDASGNFYGLSVAYAQDYYGTSSTILWRVSPTGVVTNLGAISETAIGSNVGYSIILDGTTVYGVCDHTGSYDYYTNTGAITGGMIWKWTAAGGIEQALSSPGDLAFAPVGLMKHSNGSIYCLSTSVENQGLSLWAWTTVANDSPTLVADGDFDLVGGRLFSNSPLPLVEDANGLIFGAFPIGGANNMGTLWSIDPTAEFPAPFTLLHTFSGVTGATPGSAKLAFSSDGSLRGTARDVVWRFGPAAPSGSALPVITSVSTASLTATSVSINGTVNSSSADTIVTVEWGPSATNLPNRLSATPGSLLAADPATPVTAALSGLVANTTYFYRIAAQNVNGTAYSAPQSFKTLAAIPPVVVSTAVLPADISPNGSKTNGTVNPKGASVTVYCDYGLAATAAALTNTVTSASVLTGTTVQPVSFTLTGLLPHTKYYYRIRASGSMGSAFGATLNFTTGNNAPVGVKEVDDLVAGTHSALALPSAPVTIDVCANDTDADGDPLTVFSFVAPPAAQGTMTKIGGKLIFTPSATFAGPVNTTYVATDAFGAKSAATPLQINLGTCTPPAIVNAPAGMAFSPSNLAGLNDAGLTAATFQVIQDVDVPATAPFTVVESLAWLTAKVVIDPGAGISKAVLTLLPNSAVGERSGIIKIGGQPVSVKQAGVSTPSLDLSGLTPSGKVGAPYRSVVGLTGAPATLSVVGTLPPGIKFYANSGIFAGVPTAGGTYSITLKATNLAGNSGTPTPFTFTIGGMPTEAVGAFAANVDRGLAVNGDLGARVTFKVTPTGALTGSITVEGAAISFTGVANPDFDAGYSAGSLIEVKRAGKPSYFLTLLIDSAGVVSGNMALPPGTVGSPPVAPLTGHGTLSAAGSLATRYVSVIQINPESAGPGLPEGDGYLTMVAKADGTITLGGKLTDGTAITGATILGKNPDVITDFQVLIHVPLYTGTGSYQAVVNITPRPTPDDKHLLAGVSTWLKKPQALSSVRAYRSGFFAEPTVSGWEWVNPTGTNVLELLAGPSNAQIAASGGGIEQSVQIGSGIQTLSLSDTNVAVFDTPINLSAAPSAPLLTISASTGQFTGSFKLIDPDGYKPSATVTRTVSFEGVIVPGDTGPFGSGFFLLSKLQADSDHPALPANPASTTSQLSGLLRLGPNTSGF